MTNKVGPKGQVVIPKPFRDELGIRPGDEVIFWLEDGDLHLKRARNLKTLRGLLAGAPATDELLAERRWELEKEERRAGPPRSPGTA
jgi:AbrB family looped-hinge helix DNA binding protein